jgi:hypothetical protein
MSIRKWDFRTGGYRYMHRGDDGEYWFNGTFHTVGDDEFLIQTFEFEGAPDMVKIEYMWFAGLGGGRSRASRPVRLPEHRGPRWAAVVRHGRRHDRGLRAAG